MEQFALSVDRLGLVFDRYFEKNLKFQTRKFRRVENQVAVCEETPIWSKFSDFMRND